MNSQRVEKILDNRFSSVGGSLLVMPVLLVFVLFGTITFTAVRQPDRVIAKILQPPPPEPQLQAEFSMMENSFESVLPEFEMDFDDFQRELQPETMADEPIVTTSVGQTMALELEAAGARPQYQGDTPAIEVENPGLYDPSTQVAAQQAEQSGLTVLNRAAGPGSRRHDENDLPAGGQVAYAGDGADRVTDSMLAGAQQMGDAVVVRRGASATTSGVGIEKPISEEKENLARWILRNETPLRPAIQNALEYSALKDDLTSVGQVVDDRGTLYSLFFLYRHENNLLRILVVVGQTAYRIDLPDFYLDAKHVQQGEVFRDRAAEGGIIEVSLAAVPAIPDEVPGIFEIVLQWLEIKRRD